MTSRKLNSSTENVAFVGPSFVPSPLLVVSYFGFQSISPT